MTGKYNLVTVSPTFSHLFHAASGGVDVLFDWQAVQIPKGACIIKSISIIVAGVDGVAGNTSDMKLYFAKSINGVAPTTFGTVHAVNTDVVCTAFRRNVIAHAFFDFSALDDTDSLVSYNVIGSRTSNTHVPHHNITLQGELVDDSPGYQTIYIAAEAAGAAYDFGTEVDLDNTSNVAANMTGASVQITTQGTDPRKVFQPGDLIQGHTGTVTAEVVSVDSSTTMTVKNISAQIDDDEHLILQQPMVFHISLEY